MITSTIIDPIIVPTIIDTVTAAPGVNIDNWLWDDSGDILWDDSGVVLFG